VIGKDCLFAPGVFVTASDYSLDPDSTIKSQVTRERDVIIGDDVWIGTGCVITAGVEIGHGAVIGAGSVVRRSVPAGAFVAGNPGHVGASRLRIWFQNERGVRRSRPHTLILKPNLTGGVPQAVA
jgi:acetyltransferase-like isoleucine patch superfamily enzyme